MKTKTLGALALAFLPFALFGCAQSTAQVDTPITLIMSASPSPTRMATVSPVAPSTLISQKTAAPTITVTNTPIFPTSTSAPLSQTGPWLMVYNRIDTGRGFDQDLLREPIFTNADGSAWEPANLPYDTALDEPEPRQWFSRINTKGPYIAFREDLDLMDLNYGPFTPTCNKDEFARPDENGRYNTLYILKLPENKIVNQFRLLGEKAIEQFRKEECNNAQKGSHNHEIPPVLGTVMSKGNFAWSPDGRYLVFTAAPDYPAADLYLYDTKSNNFHRLTKLQNNPMFISWKPDGSIGLYKSMTKMVVDLPPEWKSNGFHAVSVEGEDRVLLSDFQYFVGWFSPNQFFVDDGYCQFKEKGLCTTNLRLINIPNVSSVWNEVVYNNPKHYYSFEVDPVHQVILVWGPERTLVEKGKTELTPGFGETVKSDLVGVYEFDLKTHTLNKIMDGDISYLGWDARLKAFQGSYTSSNQPDTSIFYLRFEPGKGWVQMPDYIKINQVSPDWNWFIREGENYPEMFITDTQGHPIQKVEDNWGCFSPASDDYVEMVHERDTSTARLIIYAKQNNWQPNLIRSINTDQFWFCTSINP